MQGRSDQDSGQRAIRVLKALRLAAVAPSLGGICVALLFFVLLLFFNYF